ncbi:hypothetical protein [Perlabentimonas gracilis]|uniref:hypothetical protein n=1 Tax=Perlabentimonas gracilis TaxID=2715279 RepID=UPI0014097552|nr:hypothetical protein [Perlabentimonas gracilis]
MNTRFVGVYVKTIYYYSIVGLLFYCIIYLFPSFGHSLNLIGELFFPNNTTNNTIIIYTIESSYLDGTLNYLKNPGFAWEAGLYSIFVNIALYFSLFSLNKPTVSSLFNVINLVLIGTVLSTFSTAGYIGLFFIILMFLFSVRTKLKYLYIISFLLIGISSYLSLEYLGDKISDQAEQAFESQNRFGSFLLDWEDIKKRPLMGWSRDEKILFGDDAWTLETHRPNGITNLIRSYGLLYFLLLGYLWFLSIKRYLYYSGVRSRIFKTFVFLAALYMMAFSQLVLNSYFFLSLLFLNYSNKRYSYSQNK